MWPFHLQRTSIYLHPVEYNVCGVEQFSSVRNKSESVVTIDKKCKEKPQNIIYARGLAKSMQLDKSVLCNILIHEFKK